MYHYTEVDLNIKSSANFSIAVDSQTIAQAELNAYIEAQAQAIAPLPEIQFIDLDGFYTYSAVAHQVIVTITHDCGDFVT